MREFLNEVSNGGLTRLMKEISDVFKDRGFEGPGSTVDRLRLELADKETALVKTKAELAEANDSAENSGVECLELQAANETLKLDNAGLRDLISTIQGTMLGEGGIPRPLTKETSLWCSKRIDLALSQAPASGEEKVHNRIERCPYCDLPKYKCVAHAKAAEGREEKNDED